MTSVVRIINRSAYLRYCLRPPVSQERLSMAQDGSGKIVLKLERPLADGRATLEMTPSPRFCGASSQRFPATPVIPGRRARESSPRSLAPKDPGKGARVPRRATGAGAL